ncbi:hypothetical protein LTR37_007216 [Vermiconidia calcicola]|uniref:Uncharacterized protein n=1 Tax=Vermiconidia calcicola TaxID=1690605 RepID=A0ACC3NEI4_9PEZI|nr:hypothetical protein LTR37_007216 [Vermiconidia calcicola]
MQGKKDEASGRTMLMQHDAKGMLEDYRRKLEADASKHSRPTLMPLSANVPTFTPPAHYSHLIGCGCISCRQSELRWKWSVNLDVPHVPYQSSSQPSNGNAINAAAPEDRNATEIKKLTALVETLGEEIAQVRKTSEKRKVKSDKRKKELEQLRDANKIKRESEVQDRSGDHSGSGEGELESLTGVNEVNEMQWSSSTLMDEVPSANMIEDEGENRPRKRRETASRPSLDRQASPMVVIPKSERTLWNEVPPMDEADSIRQSARLQLSTLDRPVPSIEKHTPRKWTEEEERKLATGMRLGYRWTEVWSILGLQRSEKSQEHRRAALLAKEPELRAALDET